MEGLLLAEALAPLRGRTPVPRLPWRFPDDRTAVLPLAGEDALWILSRPPQPRLAIRTETPPGGATHTPFQALLAARAVGPLIDVRQQGLDRVAELEFGPEQGFVPRPGVSLVVELTGRNANLVLLDGDRRILGVERVIGNDRNRYRELRAGVAYRPPPPYDKRDPRGASAAELRRLLEGRRPGEIGRLFDGVGPALTAAFLERSSLPADRPLAGADLDMAAASLAELTRAPSAFLAGLGERPGLAEQRRRQRREHALRLLREEAAKRLELTQKRLRDADQAEEAASQATDLRGEADLLMAFGGGVPGGARSVRLEDFEGAVRTLTLDPSMDARANARKRYERARKRDARAERAAKLRPELEDARAAARRALEELEGLDDAELLRRAEALERARRQRRSPAAPGLRLRDPRGFEVIIGRSARENDLVTFRVARSRDLWLHAQGYPGSHVVVLGAGREIPFDTVLFAARLAAGYSAARQSDNVPVDYTQRKHVWKVKGQPPGAVHLTQQKTVYVTPARDDVAAARPEPA